jgi:two-component system sensor histidine kinase YesM
LNKGNDYYTIAQEINQIKAYINIQHARFPNRFTPQYEIDPEAGSYLTMKLLLQPIVENAILHAFNIRKDEPGVLAVSGRIIDHQIVMVIEDNGCGLSPEKMELLLNGADTSKQGYGIRNVNERLRMMFGPEHGLIIESKPHVGTQVTLRIPMIESEEQWRLLYENHGH